MCNVSYAVESDYSKPVIVESDKQIAELNKDRVTFLDNVVIKQGTIKITAHKVEVFRGKDGKIRDMRAIGTPAKYSQMMENNRPVEASANFIIYNPSTQTITLEKNAEIKQENSSLKGEKITYNITTEKMEALGGKTNKRVTTVFIPAELQNQVNDTKKNKSN
jgi:lipopolysaccharide export system protein LptA